MPTQPVIKRLAHLGLIAAFFHEIGLPRMMDSEITAEHFTCSPTFLRPSRSSCLYASAQW
ncbi:hypothetical protein VCHA40O235_20474 [Vibrio chagasii]|nr:hypothetical protein VCHA40O235_20474 [Vibrio chagasii]